MMPEPKLNEVLVEDFYFVCFVPKDTRTGFYICGGGPGAEIPTPGNPILLPQITTKLEQAKEHFRLSSEHAEGLADGSLCLVHFQGGKVVKMMEVKGEGQQELSA